MKIDPRAVIWIIGENKASLARCQSLLEKHFTVIVFQGVSQLPASLNPRLVFVEAVILDSKPVHLPKYEKFSPPIILLSDSDNLQELRMAYQAITAIRVKPFNHNELIAYLEKIVDPGPLSTQMIQCNPISRKVSVGGKTSSELTYRELQIFLIFHASRDYTVRRKDIVSQVWGNVRVVNKSLDVHLFNLRKKISKAGLEILFSIPDFFTLSIAKPKAKK